MTTAIEQRATLNVPAEYLDDVRAAVVAEVADSSRSVEANHEAAINGDGGDEDWISSAEILTRNMALLDAVKAADGAVELTATQDRLSSPLIHVLEEMARLLSARLAEVVSYGPTPQGDVLDIAARLRWVAREAIRIEPRVGDRLRDHAGTGRTG